MPLPFRDLGVVKIFRNNCLDPYHYHNEVEVAAGGEAFILNLDTKKRVRALSRRGKFK